MTVTVPVAQYGTQQSVVSERGRRAASPRRPARGRDDASQDEVVVSYSFPRSARPDLDALRGDLENRAIAPHVDVHLARARP